MIVSGAGAHSTIARSVISFCAFVMVGSGTQERASCLCLAWHD